MTSRKPGKEQKENPVECTGEGKRWKGNIREGTKEGSTIDILIYCCCSQQKIYCCLHNRYIIASTICLLLGQQYIYCCPNNRHIDILLLFEGSTLSLHAKAALHYCSCCPLYIYCIYCIYPLYIYCDASLELWFVIACCYCLLITWQGSQGRNRRKIKD